MLRHLSAWLLLLLLMACQQPQSDPEKTPEPATSVAAPEATETPATSASETPAVTESPAAVDPFDRDGQPTPAVERTPRAVTNPFNRGGGRPAMGNKDPWVELLALTTDEDTPDGVQQTFSPQAGEIFVRIKPHLTEANQTLRGACYSLADPSTKSSDGVALGEGEQDVVLSFEPPGETWVVGSHRLEVTYKEEIIGQLDFRVEGEQPEPDAHSFSRLLLTLEPTGKAQAQERFSVRDGAIYLVVGSSKLEPGTKIHSVWSAVKVPGLGEGEIVDRSTAEAEKGRDNLFTFKPPKKGFLVGSYRVEVYKARDREAILDFEIGR